MTDEALGDPLLAASGRRGHFRMESGLHSDLWLDLDGLFVDPERIAPSVRALAARLEPHDVAVVCGPLLGGAFLAQSLAREMGVSFVFTERVGVASEGLFGARYRLPHGLVEGVRGQRVALVDDVMSAGSSLRATHAELSAHGAIPVVVAALTVLGSRGSDHFDGIGLPVECLSRHPLVSWTPDDCPLCRAGMTVENV